MKNRKLTNVLALIYAGADINAVNNEGNSALHTAVGQAEWPYKDPSWSGSLKFWDRSIPDAHFVELLLVFDADTSIRNRARQLNLGWYFSLHQMFRLLQLLVDQFSKIVCYTLKLGSNQKRTKYRTNSATWG